MAPLVLYMHASSPSVYLDHWALGTIARDASLTERLRQAIVCSGGTLCVSWINLAEFAGSSQQSIGEAQNLLHSIFPRLFFIESDPWKTIDRENALDAGCAHLSPHGNPEVLRALTFVEPGRLEPYSVDNLVSEFAAASREVEMPRLAAVFLQRLDELRSAVQRDPDFLRLVSTVPGGPGHTAGTRFFLRQVLRPMVKDHSRRPCVNDAMDFYHTIVPVCYCDYVLIDSHWATLARQAIQRLRRAGHRAPFANIIQAGPSAIQRLMAVLVGHASPPAPNGGGKSSSSGCDHLP